MIRQNLRELLEENVTWDIEGIDHLYLDAYQSMLQTGGLLTRIENFCSKFIDMDSVDKRW